MQARQLCLSVCRSVGRSVWRCCLRAPLLFAADRKKGRVRAGRFAYRLCTEDHSHRCLTESPLHIINHGLSPPPLLPLLFAYIHTYRPQWTTAKPSSPASASNGRPKCLRARRVPSQLSRPPPPPLPAPAPAPALLARSRKSHPESYPIRPRSRKKPPTGATGRALQRLGLSLVCGSAPLPRRP